MIQLWNKSGTRLRSTSYLGAGKGFAEGHRAGDFRHWRLLLNVRDGAHALVDFSLA
jgi:hypothetical protein